MANKSNTYKTLAKNRKNLFNTVKKIQDQVLYVSEEMLDLGIETGEKYQKIATKAIKKSQPIMDKQMDIIMDSIEEMKAQYSKGNKKFLKLLGVEKELKKLSASWNKTFNATKKQITDTVLDFEERLSGITSEEVKSAKKTVSKTKAKVSKRVKSININKLSNLAGIGPKMESVLKEAGITNMNELINTDVKSLKEIINKAGARYAKVNPTQWIKEAKKAINAAK